MEPREFIAQIAQVIDAGQAIAFCGAGISKNSGVPLAGEFIGYVLKKLDLFDSETAVTTSAGLPFEAFVEILSEARDISPLLEIYKTGEPNIAHLLLAKLMKLGKMYTICTTNFDNLIEKALEIEGLSVGAHYELIQRASHLGSIDLNDDRKRLVKLHGSTEGDDIAITLRQVASRILSEQRQQLIKQIFSEGNQTTVLVMGYSCSDVFDISPAIEALDKDRKRVILIDHRKRGAKDHCAFGRIEDIALKLEKNPFRRFRGSQRFFYDTDELMNVLWNFFVDHDYQHRNSHAEVSSWKGYVDQWFDEVKNRISEAAIPTIKGWVFLKTGRPQRAEVCFSQALEMARAEGHSQGKATNLGNLGFVKISLAKVGEGLQYLDDALRLSRKIGDHEGASRHLVNLALFNLANRQYHKSIEYVDLASEVLRKVRYSAAENALLIIKGAALFMLNSRATGLRFMRKGLQRSKDQGDEDRALGALYLLGSLTAYGGEPLVARDLLLQALQAADAIGNDVAAGVIHRQLALLYRILQDRKKTLFHCEQSIGKISGRLNGSPEFLKPLQQALEWANSESAPATTGKTEEEEERREMEEKEREEKERTKAKKKP